MKLFNDNILQNKELLRDLLRHVDLFNSINGGTVNTSIEVVGYEDCILVKVAAPSVKVDAFNILLNYTRLTVSIWVKEEHQGHHRPLLVPLFAKGFDIPALVDLDKIEALYEEGELKVILPFKQTEESLQRMIEIKER